MPQGDCIFCAIVAGRAPALGVHEAFDPGGLNLVQATRPAAFQTVFHFHMHVIPRYEGDGIVPPWVARSGDPARIGSAAARLRAVL